MAWIISALKTAIANVNAMDANEHAYFDGNDFRLDDAAWNAAFDHLSMTVATSALDWAFGVLGRSALDFNRQPLENRIVCLEYIGE